MSFRPVLATSLSALLVASLVAQTRRAPDFSGHWIWVEALVAGATRSVETPSAGRRSSVHTSSGAAFNCGSECTVLHKGATLTVENARLAGDKGNDPSQRTPSVTFRIDGREADVIDSVNPPMKLTAAAKWDGNKLQIASRSRSSSISRTQVLSLEDGHLVVVHIATVGGEPVQVTMKYRKK